MPMNRSRDRTMHAMISEKVANSAEPRTITNADARRAGQIPAGC